MRKILKATVIDAKPRWGVEGYGTLEIRFGDGASAEGYVGVLDDAGKGSAGMRRARREVLLGSRVRLELGNQQDSLGYLGLRSISSPACSNSI
jgi:hypothetical protein